MVLAPDGSHQGLLLGFMVGYGENHNYDFSHNFQSWPVAGKVTRLRRGSRDSLRVNQTGSALAVWIQEVINLPRGS
ncbi:hypothetical protein [Xanthomonas sp. SHU 199]|uniref:hypothetical protein n=1 Tax=Xanthomonas sp. SHU 199 TaxID=1591174 RepID=UPI0012FE882F|nr:hypothetical protein [Xanthomonas sp. SHU 199]